MPNFRVGQIGLRPAATSPSGFPGNVVNGEVLASGKSQLAFARGRSAPWRSSGAILGYLERNVFATDNIGFPFPAGQLWARTWVDQFAGSGDTDVWWSAVPETLPAGYTLNNARNVNPSVYVRPSATGFNEISLWPHDDPSTSYHDPVFRLSYSSVAGNSANPVLRTANGLYNPVATAPVGYLGRALLWGPFNHNRNTTDWNLGSQNKVHTDRYTPLHPGYRNVRITVTWVNAFYSFAPADTAVEIKIDGVTTTVTKAMLTSSGSNWVYSVDVGPTTQTAAGVLRQVIISAALTGSLAPGTYSGTNVRLRGCPRLDIPFPWTMTHGDLVAPGGVVTGSIPGF